MGIGEVLAHLRPDFPEVTISKLRFLEAEGLVEPYRAPSGYRKYTPDHLTRLRYVLAAQRDRYLPLRVIREQLAAFDRGEPVVGLTAALTAVGDGPADASARTGTVLWPVGGPGERVASRLTRAELLAAAGLREEQLAGLEQYGLFGPGVGGLYDPEALSVARIAAQLMEYGLEPRHLRPYRAAADRELGLLAQLVTPVARAPGPGGRAQAAQQVQELAALFAQLHAALVCAGMRQVLGT